MNSKTLFDMLDIFLRSIFSIIGLFIAARLMGKRQISQLTFFDYIIGITIGSIAAQFSIDKSISYINGIISIGVWSFTAIIIGKVNLKNVKIRRVFEGIPSILIQNGKIIEKNLKKERIDINNLLEELRKKGEFDISKVEFAILETNGEISIQPKAENKPLTRKDLNIGLNYEGLCINLIIDGEIMWEHLKIAKLDQLWLKFELQKRNIKSSKEVLLAYLDYKGEVHIDMKNSDPIDEFKVLD